MRCTTAKQWISESLDEKLGPKRSAKLERHLASCAGCREIRENFQEIVASAQQLENPAPADDLWQGILARLREARAAGAAPPRIARKEQSVPFGASALAPVFRFAAAGLAIVVVAAAVFFGVRQFRGEAPIPWDKSMAVTVAKLQEAQTYYRLAIKALDEAIAAQTADLNPGVDKIFQGNRRAVDTSIKLCEQDVAGDPENIEARNMLLGAYQRKLNLLNELLAAKKASVKSATRSIM